MLCGLLSWVVPQRVSIADVEASATTHCAGGSLGSGAVEKCGSTMGEVGAWLLCTSSDVVCRPRRHAMGIGRIDRTAVARAAVDEQGRSTSVRVGPRKSVNEGNLGA